jgi:plastocyanin
MPVYPVAVSRVVIRTLSIGFAVAVLLSACGGSGGAQPPGSMKVTLTEYRFDPSTISVGHGKVVFFLVNGGTISHDLVVTDSSGNRVAASELISAGDSVVLNIDNLPAGTYTFFCDQPGHEQAGMKGTLTAT